MTLMQLLRILVLQRVKLVTGWNFKIPYAGHYPLRGNFWFSSFRTPTAATLICTQAVAALICLLLPLAHLRLSHLALGCMITKAGLKGLITTGPLRPHCSPAGLLEISMHTYAAYAGHVVGTTEMLCIWLECCICCSQSAAAEQGG